MQISLNEGERFIKLDHDGEESAWSDTLEDVLPFALTEEPQPDPATQEDEDEDDDDDEDDDTPYDSVHEPRH